MVWNCVFCWCVDRISIASSGEPGKGGSLLVHPEIHPTPCYSTEEIFATTGPIARAAATLACHGFVVAVPEFFHEWIAAGTALTYTPEDTAKGNSYKVRRALWPVSRFFSDVFFLNACSSGTALLQRIKPVHQAGGTTVRTNIRVPNPPAGGKNVGCIRLRHCRND